MADVAEIVSCDSTDVQSDFPGIDRSENFLLLRHRVVQLQFHLLGLHIFHHGEGNEGWRKPFFFLFFSFIVGELGLICFLWAMFTMLDPLSELWLCWN